ncbi:hypothetical protein PV367_04835 [Streptomyces europaeiscabiei]|uniref:Lipoprotein n=1 Tax=Streptomyces europaeiscabiei TaxID=146819 RepID=A0AAJ2PLB1_9ACTN|nr:hypothetical protein [Streptomyces europaeiscabiei]MDX3129141.1 hypothetical protein [Streptomyces europaeiscabiei]
MYDSVRRSCAVSAVVWVVALGATACTEDSGDGATRDDGRARAASCTDGEYAWSGVRHRTKLTALGEPVTFAKGTDSYRTRLEPLDADTVHRPTVSGVPAGVAPARVIKALGAHLKVEEPLAGPSEEERPEESVFGWHAGELEGAYYLWNQIGFVDADFSYTCGDAEPVRGHVHTWETVGKGFLSCDTTPDGAAGRAAAEELCPAGSRAAKAA